jgi:hypothetical protein
VVAPLIAQVFIPWINSKLGSGKDSAVPKRRPKGKLQQRRATLLQSGGGGIVGVLFGFLVMSPLLVSSCPPFAATRVSFTLPKTDASVPRLLPVQGTACNVPDGKQVWLLVLPEGTTACHPQTGPIMVSRDGNWTASAYVGLDGAVDVGRGFILIAALADPSGSNAMRQYFDQADQQFNGFATLPPGIQLMDQVRVLRR